MSTPYRIVHHRWCDFADQIVGQEIPLAVAHRGDPVRDAVCSCGANPTLVKPTLVDDDDAPAWMAAAVDDLVQVSHNGLVPLGSPQVLRILQQHYARKDAPAESKADEVVPDRPWNALAVLVHDWEQREFSALLSYDHTAVASAVKDCAKELRAVLCLPHDARKLP